MGLSVVARFSSLVEARVACGALQAAGIDAQLFDQNFGSVMWIDQTAIGGFRVVVPDAVVANAAAYFRDFRPPAPTAEPAAEDGVRVGDYGLSVLALVLAFVLGPVAGWLVVGARRGRFDWRVVGLAVVTLGLVVVTLVLTTDLIGAFLGRWLRPA
jgi:MFS family permease